MVLLNDPNVRTYMGNDVKEISDSSNPLFGMIII